MAKSKKKPKRTFLAIYLGSPGGSRKWEKLPAKTQQEREAAGVRAWHEWVRKNRKSIVHGGAPLGTTKRISRRGIAGTRNALCAFTIVTAPSHAAAAKIFRKHPHFMIFPGDSVEVMECLKVPGM